MFRCASVVLRLSSEAVPFSIPASVYLAIAAGLCERQAVCSCQQSKRPPIILPKGAHRSALQVPFPSLDRMLECDPEAEDPPSPVFHRALSLPPSTPSQRDQSRNGCPSSGLHLVTQYPVLKGNSTGARQAEFASTLEKNLAHDQVSPVSLSCWRKGDQSLKSRSLSASDGCLGLDRPCKRAAFGRLLGS
jgi:hypothetical protein